ncbi:hypothetical protein [Segetibacter aerophilus]|uniref:Lipoprotein n=1 Tax=Segetibacter aerophilus TaxID=670293 RepID=A0A512B9F2_9BACT|nr:hypothetical protein [Segetibacter aerophilus]GEO08582.1 hypothetical protein SAE01_10780 [Segetibacter aerophilus]
MKKVAGSVLLLVLIISAITSCKKIINSVFPGVDVDVPEVVFTVPAPPPLPPGFPVPTSEQAIGSLSQSFNLDSAVKAKTNGQFGAGDVTSVKIKQIIFNMSNADELNNFSNFESARFTFASNASQNTPEIEVASLTFPQTNTSVVTYTAPDNAPELRPYLNGTKLTYNVYGKLRRYTTKAISISVKVTMKVK